MVLDQPKFYIKWHKSKYFWVTFSVLEYYQDINLPI